MILVPVDRPFVHQVIHDLVSSWHFFHISHKGVMVIYRKTTLVEPTLLPTHGHDQQFITTTRNTRRDLYTAALTAPRARHEILCALIMLDHEWARTPHLVSDPMLGSIRLQWWRDAITQTTCGLRPPHPALHILAPSLAAGSTGLEQALHARINQHEMMLAPLVIPDLAIWHDITRDYFLPFAMAWCILWGDVMPPPALMQHISLVCGATEWLYHLPAFLSLRQCPLPLDILTQHQSSPARMIDFPRDPAMAETIKACYQTIDTALQAFSRQDHQRLGGLAGLLMVTQGRLKAMRAAGFHPVQHPDHWYRPDGMLGLRIWWHSLITPPSK